MEFLKALKKVMLKCEEGIGYGLTIEEDKYIVEDIPEGYHRFDEGEIDIWRDKYSESLYDDYDLDEYEADDIVDKLELVKPCVSFEEYNSNPDMQNGYDLYVQTVSSAFEPIYIYLVFNLKEKLLCLWGPDMEEY